MDDIIQLLKTDPKKAIEKLTIYKKDKTEIENSRKEFQELYRGSRDMQIQNIQKDKIVGETNQKVVKKVKIPIPFQNKIVRTATAFEVGEPPTLIPDEKNELTDEIIRLWKVNRIDSLLQKAKTLQKSELQCAISFYIKEQPSSNSFYKLVGVNKKKDIKCRIFENKNGEMSPYFDEYGDMIAFVWEFSLKDPENGNKEKKHFWVWDKKNVYTSTEGSEGYEKPTVIEHGFDRIPIVYLEQEKPEWFIAKDMIDRLEVTLSRLGDANDYTGHPILKIFGKVTGAPEKDEEGKAFLIPMEENEETNKIEHGNVEFLTYDHAPESVKLEIERIEKYIFSLTSTPDISFESIKGLGTISGIAIKFLFLDAIVKAKMNEGENRTIIERINNILIGGTITTTVTKYSKYLAKTFLNVKFNSIIPDDIKEEVETLVYAVEGKIMSRKTAIEKFGAVDDYEEELARIESESSDDTENNE